MSIYNNASWPRGRWRLSYNADEASGTDWYDIETEYGDRIARVYSTLVAHWLVRLYNAIHESF